jgi:hypothetical protein
MNALEVQIPEVNSLVSPRTIRVLIVTAFAAVAGCVVGCVVGGGYDGGATVGYDVGFYEPFGYDYGGWGPGYGVGRPDVHSAPHSSYRPAASSRPMPSLPSHSRGR